MLRDHPKPTHYSSTINKHSGTPDVGPLDSFDPGDDPKPLPEHWDERFWRWKNGEWVEQADGARAQAWSEAQKLTEQEASGNVTVSVGGRSLTFAADEATRNKLMRHVVASLVEPAWPGVDWLTAGNATVTLDKAAVARVFAAMAAQEREAENVRVARRTRIFDTGKPLVRSVDDVLAAVPRNSGR